MIKNHIHKNLKHFFPSFFHLFRLFINYIMRIKIAWTINSKNESNIVWYISIFYWEICVIFSIFSWKLFLNQFSNGPILLVYIEGRLYTLLLWLKSPCQKRDVCFLFFPSSQDIQWYCLKTLWHLFYGITNFIYDISAQYIVYTFVFVFIFCK